MSREEKLKDIRDKRISEFQQVEKLRKSGVLLAEACKQVGMAYATYGNWRHKLGTEEAAKPVKKWVAKSVKRHSKPTIHAVEIPAIQPARLMVFVGNPIEVMAAVRAL
jgi:hypothetical protein